MIKSFYEITKDGELLSPEWVDSNVGENFQIREVVGAQWVANDISVVKKYEYVAVPEILPSQDAVIVMERSEVPPTNWTLK